MRRQFVIVKKQADISFSCVCPVIDNFIIKHFQSMTKVMINNRKDA